MRFVFGLMVLAFTFSLGLAHAPRESPAPSADPMCPSGTTAQQSDSEINKLIVELGDADFKVRETATKRLAEIGVPALDALYLAEEKGEPESRKRAAMLVQSIRMANRLPTRVNGMEFKLIIDNKEW